MASSASIFRNFKSASILAFSALCSAASAWLMPVERRANCPTLAVSCARFIPPFSVSNFATTCSNWASSQAVREALVMGSFPAMTEP